MNNFLKLLLGTGIYLLEQSDESTKRVRSRAADNLSDLRDFAQEKYETAADRVSRASRAIRGDDGRLGNALSLVAGIGIGVAVGMIFAPASGEETRSAIADKVQMFGGKVKEQWATGTNG